MIFKKGDKVRRIKNNFGRINKGDIKIIFRVSGRALYFKDDYLGYNHECFVLSTIKNWRNELNEL